MVEPLKDNYGSFESICSQALTAALELDKIRSIEFKNLLELKTLQRELRTIQARITDLIEKQFENRNRLTELTTVEKTSREDLASLRRLLAYFEQPEYLKLSGVGERLLNVQRATETNAKLENILKDIILDDFQDRVGEFGVLLEQTTANLNAKKTSKVSVERELNQLKEAMSQIGRIEAEIKALGKEYLSHNHSAKECPLCQAVYEHSELIRRINEVQSQLSGDLKIVEATEKSASLNLEISSLESELNQYTLVERAARLALAENFLQFDLKKLYKTIIDSMKELQDTIEHAVEYQALEEKARVNGFSETELHKLIESIQNIDLSVGEKAKVNSLIEEKEKEVANILASITEQKAIEEKLEKELASISLEQGQNSSPSEIQSLLTNRMRTISTAFSHFDQLKKYFEVSETETISEILLQIRQVEDLFNGFMKATKDNQQLKVVDSILISAKAKLGEDVSPKLKRVQDGLDAIEAVLNEDEKDSILTEFFKKNDDQIQDIFRRIHTPRELEKVLFFEEGISDIRILRTNGKQCKINEISSGQRSALALSIFLTLNKKLKNGPNVVLLDDPVAYIDDMNTLSFLDYLRDVVIHEDRQLFFATASQKLSSFFDKKFGFLKPKDEFKYFSLER